MKRGFLKKAEGGLLSPNPVASSSSLTTASSSLPSDKEPAALVQEFQNLLRENGLGHLEASGLISQKLQGSSASQADSDQQKMFNELYEGGRKLEYGKVETVAVPKDYKPAKIPIAYQDPKKVDQAANTLLFTTIPSGPIDPDGHSEWVVHGPTKAKVINAPGYPKPVPKPKGPLPAYIIKQTPNMGLGMFATKDIKMGELIFAERPLLVTPRSNLGVPMQIDEKTLRNYDLKTQIAIAMIEWEKILEVAVGRMKPEKKKAFMELANSHKEDGSGPILGIIRTNGFRVGSNVYDGPTKREDGTNAYSGVIKIGSRINHSCMPNVKIEFSTPSFSFQISALVDIKAGEQLFYAYCGVYQSVAKRQAELAPYGIVCACPACTHATPETDKLRTEYEKIAMGYMFDHKITSGGQVAESVIKPVIQFKDALIREGLHYTKVYKSMILLIQQFYERNGMEKKARPYREEYERYNYKLFA